MAVTTNIIAAPQKAAAVTAGAAPGVEAGVVPAGVTAKAVAPVAAGACSAPVI